MSDDKHASDDEDDNKSFTSARSDALSYHDPIPIEPDKLLSDQGNRFSPEEEASLVAASNELKTSANAIFAKAGYEEAIRLYSRSQASCPAYLDYESAVLHSNTAACHLCLSQWEQAETAATKALDALDRLDPMEKEQSSNVEEVDDVTADKIQGLQQSGQLQRVRQLRVKALMRRAKARAHIGSWAALQGAEQDYTHLSRQLPDLLTPGDEQKIKTELARLAPRVDDAKQKEMAEMMSKLKGLGNSLLRPFGLSTDNFNFVKDEKSGGYSMNMSQ